MNRDLLDLTPDQLRVYKALQIERRAWFALASLIGLVSAGFVAFLFAAFTNRQVATIISGGIDGLFGWQLKQVYRHIYPDPKA